MYICTYFSILIPPHGHKSSPLPYHTHSNKQIILSLPKTSFLITDLMLIQIAAVQLATTGTVLGPVGVSIAKGCTWWQSHILKLALPASMGTALSNRTNHTGSGAPGTRAG